MPDATLTRALFTLLVLIMVGLSAGAIRRTRAQGVSLAANSVALLALAVAYLIVPGALALSGVLNQYTPLPRPMLVIVPLTTMTLVVAFSRFGAHLASALPLSVLVGFQVFRVPLELILHRLADEALIPYLMTYSGWNFDIVTGLSAGVLGVVLWHRAVPRPALLAWNVAGLLLLLTIVTIAALAAPGPLQTFTDGPPNMLLSNFPYVWLPTVLVQLALMGHILMFRRLGQRATA